MQTSNTKENGFETLIVDYIVNNNNYESGTNNDYNKAIRMTFGNVIDYLNEFKAMLEDKKLELKKAEGAC